MNSPAPNLVEIDPRLPGPLVAERYGVSDRTIDRWKNGPELGFPEPALTVHGRNYWALSALEQSERSLPSRKAANKAAA